MSACVVSQRGLDETKMNQICSLTSEAQILLGETET